MNTGAIAGIVIGAIIIVALLTLAITLIRRSRLNRRREQAREQREEAEVRTARAERLEADAAERQARADREQAIAREQAAHADADRRVASERHAEASRLDPADPEQPDGHTPAAGPDVAPAHDNTGEHGEAGRPPGLARLTRFGRRKATVAAADSGPGRRAGDAPPPGRTADAAAEDEGSDLP